MFELIWNKEVIDTAETRKEAKNLQVEYIMAFNDIVTIRKV